MSSVGDDAAGFEIESDEEVTLEPFSNFFGEEDRPPEGTFSAIIAPATSDPNGPVTPLAMESIDEDVQHRLKQLKNLRGSIPSETTPASGKAEGTTASKAPRGVEVGPTEGQSYGQVSYTESASDGFLSPAASECSFGLNSNHSGRIDLETFAAAPLSVFLRQHMRDPAKAQVVADALIHRLRLDVRDLSHVEAVQVRKTVVDALSLSPDHPKLCVALMGCLQVLYDETQIIIPASELACVEVFLTPSADPEARAAAMQVAAHYAAAGRLDQEQKLDLSKALLTCLHCTQSQELLLDAPPPACDGDEASRRQSAGSATEPPTSHFITPCDALAECMRGVESLILEEGVLEGIPALHLKYLAQFASKISDAMAAPDVVSVGRRRSVSALSSCAIALLKNYTVVLGMVTAEECVHDKFGEAGLGAAVADALGEMLENVYHLKQREVASSGARLLHQGHRHSTALGEPHPSHTSDQPDAQVASGRRPSFVSFDIMESGEEGNTAATATATAAAAAAALAALASTVAGGDVADPNPLPESQIAAGDPQPAESAERGEGASGVALPPPPVRSSFLRGGGGGVRDALRAAQQQGGEGDSCGGEPGPHTAFGSSASLGAASVTADSLVVPFMGGKRAARQLASRCRTDLAILNTLGAIRNMTQNMVTCSEVIRALIGHSIGSDLQHFMESQLLTAEASEVACAILHCLGFTFHASEVSQWEEQQQQGGSDETTSIAESNTTGGSPWQRSAGVPYSMPRRMEVSAEPVVTALLCHSTHAPLVSAAVPLLFSIGKQMERDTARRRASFSSAAKPTEQAAARESWRLLYEKSPRVVEALAAALPSADQAGLGSACSQALLCLIGFPGGLQSCLDCPHGVASLIAGLPSDDPACRTSCLAALALLSQSCGRGRAEGLCCKSFISELVALLRKSGMGSETSASCLTLLGNVSSEHHGIASREYATCGAASTFIGIIRLSPSPQEQRLALSLLCDAMRSDADMRGAILSEHSLLEMVLRMMNASPDSRPVCGYALAALSLEGDAMCSLIGAEGGSGVACVAAAARAAASPLLTPHRKQLCAERLPALEQHDAQRQQQLARLQEQKGELAAKAAGLAEEATCLRCQAELLAGALVAAAPHAPCAVYGYLARHSAGLPAGAAAGVPLAQVRALAVAGQGAVAALAAAAAVAAGLPREEQEAVVPESRLTAAVTAAAEGGLWGAVGCLGAGGAARRLRAAFAPQAAVAAALSLAVAETALHAAEGRASHSQAGLLAAEAEAAALRQRHAEGAASLEAAEQRVAQLEQDSERYLAKARRYKRDLRAAEAGGARLRQQAEAALLAAEALEAERGRAGGVTLPSSAPQSDAVAQQRHSEELLQQRRLAQRYLQRAQEAESQVQQLEGAVAAAEASLRKAGSAPPPAPPPPPLPPADPPAEVHFYKQKLQSSLDVIAHLNAQLEAMKRAADAAVSPAKGGGGVLGALPGGVVQQDERLGGVAAEAEARQRALALKEQAVARREARASRREEECRAATAALAQREAVQGGDGGHRASFPRCAHTHKTKKLEGEVRLLAQTLKAEGHDTHDSQSFVEAFLACPFSKGGEVVFDLPLVESLQSWWGMIAPCFSSMYECFLAKRHRFLSELLTEASGKGKAEGKAKGQQQGLQPLDNPDVLPHRPVSGRGGHSAAKPVPPAVSQRASPYSRRLSLNVGHGGRSSRSRHPIS